MEITTQLKVHSRTETESNEKEYVLVPLSVEDVVDDLEAISDEEFERIRSDMEGFRFGGESMVQLGSGVHRTAGIVVRSTEDLAPGDRVTLTLSYT